MKWFQSDLSYHSLCSPAPRRSGTLCASGGFEAVAASCSAFRAPLGSSSHAPSAAFAGPPVASRLHGRPRLKIVVHWVQFSHGVCSLLLLASQTRNARFEFIFEETLKLTHLTTSYCRNVSVTVHMLRLSRPVPGKWSPSQAESFCPKISTHDSDWCQVMWLEPRLPTAFQLEHGGLYRGTLSLSCWLPEPPMYRAPPPCWSKLRNSFFRRDLPGKKKNSYSYYY